MRRQPQGYTETHASAASQETPAPDARYDRTLGGGTIRSGSNHARDPAPRRQPGHRRFGAAPSPSSESVKSEVVGREREVREIFAGHAQPQAHPSRRASGHQQVDHRPCDGPLYARALLLRRGEHRSHSLEAPGLLQPGESAARTATCANISRWVPSPRRWKKGGALPRGVQPLGAESANLLITPMEEGVINIPRYGQVTRQRRLHHHLQPEPLRRRGHPAGEPRLPRPCRARAHGLPVRGRRDRDRQSALPVKRRPGWSSRPCA